jgi:hypothetical protein
MRHTGRRGTMETGLGSKDLRCINGNAVGAPCGIGRGASDGISYVETERSAPAPREGGMGPPNASCPRSASTKLELLSRRFRSGGDGVLLRTEDPYVNTSCESRGRIAGDWDSTELKRTARLGCRCGRLIVTMECGRCCWNLQILILK